MWFWFECFWIWTPSKLFECTGVSSYVECGITGKIAQLHLLQCVKLLFFCRYEKLYIIAYQIFRIWFCKCSVFGNRMVFGESPDAEWQTLWDWEASRKYSFQMLWNTHLNCLQNIRDNTEQITYLIWFFSNGNICFKV